MIGDAGEHVGEIVLRVDAVVLNAVPGKTMTPIGKTSSIWSLRLNGAALACCVQSGLKAIGGTSR
jgi:hypothetical protein